MNIFEEIKIRINGKSRDVGMAIMIAMFSCLLRILYDSNVISIHDVKEIVNIEVSWKL